MSFDFQPILVGELTRLRPLRADDFNDLYRVASDPLIWAQHPAKNRCEERVFHKFFEDALASRGALVATDIQTQSVIGSSRYHGLDTVNSEVEIGWTFLARSHWGGRYNRDMKRLMLEHAFRFVESVLLLVGPNNLRSQRAVEKIGGVRDGLRTDRVGVESLVYRLRSADFAL